MSGRFVRASSYRHVHGKTPKPDAEYSELKPQCTGEGNFIAANEKFVLLTRTLIASGVDRSGRCIVRLKPILHP